VVQSQREKIAETFYNKARESLEVADRSLTSGNYRTACNRAYYATMQVVHAAVYLHLSDTPPVDERWPNRVNWKHREVQWLFDRVSKQLNQKLDNSTLSAKIPSLVRARYVADYDSPEQGLNGKSAGEMVGIAKQIYKVLEKNLVFSL
jgi:HEPN domain-containing protein